MAKVNVTHDVKTWVRDSNIASKIVFLSERIVDY